MKTPRHIPIFLLFIALSISFGSTYSYAQKLFLYPLDKSVVNAESVQVVGSSAEILTPKAQINLSNSSGTKEYPLKQDGPVFNALLALEIGNNVITLKDKGVTLEKIEILYTNDFEKSLDKESYFFLHSAGKLLTSQCFDCHPENVKGKKRYSYLEQKISCITAKCHIGFDKGKFKHGPFETGSCVECHNPHGSKNKFFLKSKGATLCFSCHTDASTMVQEGKVVHFPVAQGNCTACHDPHKSDIAFHLKRGSIVELCAGCHGKTITNHKVLHDPVAEGDCNACHTPHTSDFKGLLTDDKKVLCFNCHEVRKDEFNSTYVHAPLKRGCTICHDPHGSAVEFHLRTKKDKHAAYVETKQPIKDLCLSCHRKLNPEIAKQIEHNKVPHKPVAEGKCTLCHTPHSTNYKKQLKASVSTICFSCHKKIKETIEGSLFKHGPVKTNDCALCHLVHGSQYKKLLRSKFSQKFSQKFNLADYALCFNCHNSKIVTDKKSPNTGFRNGTRNLHYVHVNRKKKGRNCKTCHDIHASNQEKHIRKKLIYKKKFTINIEFNKTATGGGCVVGCHKPRKYDREHKVKNK